MLISIWNCRVKQGERNIRHQHAKTKYKRWSRETERIQTKSEGWPSEAPKIFKEGKRKKQETRNERKKESWNVSVIYLTGSKGRLENHGEKDSKNTGCCWKDREREMETFCRAATPPSTSSEADLTPEHRSAEHKRMRSAKMHKYRKLQKLEQKMKEMKQTEAKYRKRCQRLRLRFTSDRSNCSPSAKTQMEVRKHQVPTHIKKTLLFHNTLHNTHYMQKKI